MQSEWRINAFASTLLCYLSVINIDKSGQMLILLWYEKVRYRADLPVGMANR